ncbi:MAG: ion transporter [Oscillospiraceae bacterium]|nr:ion transporter [Oscillospiraceae bacterium]
MKKIKSRVFNAVNPNNKQSAVFDRFILILVFINIIFIVLETFEGFLEIADYIFIYVEIFTVIIFILEYVCRLWTADMLYTKKSPFRARLKYMFSFMAFIDLFSFLPFALPFLFRFDLRVLRMLRLVRLLRLFKVTRYAFVKTLAGISVVVRRKAAQLLISMLVILIFIMVMSVLIYTAEHDVQPEVFKNAFSGLWWAINTITTIGYGDVYPVTVTGKILGGITAFLSVGFVAIPAAVLSAGFIEESHKKNEAKKEKKHFCPHCGKNLD